MEQLTLFDEKKEKICAFTGHRRLGEDFCYLDLDNAVREALEKGYRIFLNGMATGFDLFAAEAVLSHLEEYPDIRLIACIPCEEQDKYYSQDDKLRYFLVLQTAEKILFSKSYYRGCMLVRDKYMAKAACYLIAYCKRETGGTAYTVKQFLKEHPEGKIVYL